MDYVLVCLIGVFGGAFVVFILQDAKRKKLDKQHHEQESQAERIRSDKEAIATRQREIDQLSAKLAAEHKELSAALFRYQELQNENGILKRDIKDVDQQGRKLARWIAMRSGIIRKRLTKGAMNSDTAISKKVSSRWYVVERKQFYELQTTIVGYD